MTEEQWQGSTDPEPMLRFLLGTDYPRVQAVETFPDCRGSDRKLRLFACACYHRIRHLLPDVRAQAAVAVAEQVAEGILPVDELQRAETGIREPFDALEAPWRAPRGAERMALMPTHEALALALVILWPEAQKAAYYASSNAYLAFASLTNSGAASWDSGFSASRAAEQRVQADLLRCMFGRSPFAALPPLSPAVLGWNDAAARRIADGIYEERAFDRLPVLADALEEPGCTDPDILSHCRQPGEHVRGCWVVDLTLSKDRC